MNESKLNIIRENNPSNMITINCVDRKNGKVVEIKVSKVDFINGLTGVGEVKSYMEIKDLK